mmetsp:Transcript_10308/g.22863  ORF Transcript_10308/g.22863 Transcript_10308/m.22863 type:complete len:238 (-) Transcript_10308:134-847(-)
MSSVPRATSRPLQSRGKSLQQRKGMLPSGRGPSSRTSSASRSSGRHQLPAGNDVESIKEELMLHGPVLSTSFHASGEVIAENAWAVLLATTSTVIILGWKQVKDKGEVWLVRPTPQAEVVEIPIESCSLTDNVQIPEMDLRNKSWQQNSCYPFLERDFSGESDWMTWSEYEIALSGEDLNTLLQKLKTDGRLDIVNMVLAKRQIEICPIGMRAMSRRAEIRGLVLMADSWKLRTKFI